MPAAADLAPVYLDYAATTPVDPRVAATMAGYLTTDGIFGNAASVTHAYGREAARQVGELIAKRALGAGIRKVIFDRNGFLYHGRVQTLADAAREAGLEF